MAKILSEEETKLLVESWALVSPDKEKHGLEFFIKLFSEHPDVQMKHFERMDVNEIDTLQRHGFGVMRDVETMIDLIKESKDDMLVKKIHAVISSLDFPLL